MEFDFYSLERQHARKGQRVAGADEAGRGPLAGPKWWQRPAFSPADCFLEGVNDSKKLTAKKRDMLYEQIMQRAISYGIGIVEVQEIERMNILNAARHAFQQAIGQLCQPFVLYTDYITGLSLLFEYTAIKKGDAKVYSIAAASIIAKVTRDRLMQQYDAIYPEYGFAAHKGMAQRRISRPSGNLAPARFTERVFLGGF